MRKIYKGDVEITKNNQDEWNKKLVGIEEITGNLSIYSQAKLDSLKSVGGYLYIYSQAKLDSLKSVGGDLYIYSQAKLEAGSLKSVGGDLYINSKIKPELAKWFLLKYSQKRSWYLSDEVNELLLTAKLKRVTYQIEDVEFDSALFNKVRKDKLTAEEVFKIQNLEQRRVAYQRMDKIKMKSLDEYKVLDTATDDKGKKMEIVEFKIDGYKKPFRYLHCVDASTDREYHVETTADTCWKAKEKSFGLENVEWVNEW